MYCPRCGTQANEPTKFCRSCGLALTPITTYVASGGTLPLQSVVPETPKSNNALIQSFHELEPRQQRTLLILFFVFLVPLLGILGGIFPPFRALVPIAFAGMPIGIVWAVMRYKALESRLQQNRLNSVYSQSNTPPPSHQQTTYQPPLSSPTTNQLETPRLYQTPVPRSITEEETQRLPNLPSREQH